jgi:hypothetical protein
VPTYTYTGDPGRYYPTLGVEGVPGETAELDDDPGDGRWEPAGDPPEPPDAPFGPLPGPVKPAKQKQTAATNETPGE